jgi:rubrerythrin
MGAGLAVDIETRLDGGAGWRLVQRCTMGLPDALAHLLGIGGPEPRLEWEGFGAFPALPVHRGVPEDSHALIELRRRVAKLPRDMTVFSRAQREDDAEDDLLGPFRYMVVVWVTLDQLEAYPWDTVFAIRESYPAARVMCTTVRDELRPSLNSSIQILTREVKSGAGRLVFELALDAGIGRPIRNAGQAAAQTDDEYAAAYGRELGAVLFGENAWWCRSCGVTWDVAACDACPACGKPTQDHPKSPDQ